MTREQILFEIRRLAQANSGQPPGRQTFERETGIKQGVWLGKYWARWGDAVSEAGYEPNALQGRVDEGLLCRKFAEAIRHFGRIPSTAELRLYGRGDPDFPSHNTFGLKEKLLQRVIKWTSGRDGYDDVAFILGNAGAESAKEPSQRLVKEGYVYMLQSRVHYKIGRSDQLERRVKEIRITLPDAVTLVHTIKTDDPPGIEAYWHRRFADRRVNGEWFKLAPSDVAAFKRRRYQ